MAAPREMRFKDVLIGAAALAVLGLAVLGCLVALNIVAFPGALAVIIVCAILLSMLVVIVGAAQGIGLGYIWLFQTYTEEIATWVIPGGLMTCVLLSLGVAALSGIGAVSLILLFFGLRWCAHLVLLLLRSSLCDTHLSFKILKIVSQSITDNLQLLNVWIPYMLSAFYATLALIVVCFGATIYHHPIFVPNPDVLPGAPCGGGDLDAVPCSIIDLKDWPWDKVSVVLFGATCIWFVVGWKLKSLHKNAVRRTVTRWYFAHISQSTSNRSTDTSLESSVIDDVARLLASGLRFVGDACQIAAAISARPLSSAKLISNLLKRNFFSTVAVDVFAGYVLKRYSSLCMGLLWWCLA